MDLPFPWHVVFTICALLATFVSGLIGGITGAALAGPNPHRCPPMPAPPPPPVNLLNQTDLFDLECRVRRLESIERRRDLGVR